MKKIWIFLALGVGILACKPTVQNTVVSSPDGNISVDFRLENGTPYYSVNYNGEPVISDSKLGMVLANGDTLTADMLVDNESSSSFDKTWEQPWGDQKTVRNNYNEYTVSLSENAEAGRNIQIAFRAFNDGIAFRYIFPEQAELKDFVIMDELTEFNMTEDLSAWWIPAYRDNRLEYYFQKDKLSEIDTVHTPLTMEASNGLHLSIHEADLKNYAGMTIASLPGNTLKCDLAPWSDGTKVKTSAPAQTPWRTVQIADNAGELITSHLILNLNEPNKLEDLSWVTPSKYLGIWWAMHIGKYSFWESPVHGANTENSKMYIDYCNQLGIDRLLIEGWNKGWTPAWYENLLHVFDFTGCTDDFDFEEVSRYALDKGVHLIGYHETGSNIDNYLAQIDDGMQMYADAQMHDVKIGQVGSRLMLKEWHYGQYGVEYYRDVLEKAADYKLTVNFHEPIKPTGLHRTYPHLMAGEGGRGQEYNAWSEGNPPEHTVILPFTRMLGGPMDFTPGIFDITSTRVHTTLVKQLALYVAFCSPIQMLADLPENYVDQPAFKFLQDVPVNWEKTEVINAVIGDYYTVARKDIDSDDWYLGSITDENAREFEISLGFLEEGKTYKAEIYADAVDAEYDVNPEAYNITEQEVNNQSIITLKLAKGGGEAIRFKAL